MPKIDARLFACAEYLEQGKTVADVGCDHGKLTAYLAIHGFSVIGIDINEKPLENARKTCEKAKCSERVSLRLGDGLKVLEPMEAQQIVIAGVSADTILNILDSTGWVQTKGIRLVLCPATKITELRYGLCKRGFAILDETPVVAAGRCYSVVCAQYEGNPFEPSQEFCLVGKTEGKPYATELWKDTAVKLEKRIRSFDGEQQQEVLNLLKWLKQKCEQ